MELTTHTANGTYHVTLRGRFTFTDNPAFKESILNRIGDESCEKVILGMGGLNFVDSAALGMLLLAHEEAEKHRKRLMLEGVSGQVRRTLTMARFERFFTFI